MTTAANRITGVAGFFDKKEEKTPGSCARAATGGKRIAAPKLKYSFTGGSGAT